MFEKRSTKGIWKNLYQFPLIESEAPIRIEDFKDHPKVKTYLNGAPYEFSLYNEKDIVHKLSHQHLHTRFWIIEIDQISKNGVPIDSIRKFPTPVLISNFIETFEF